MKCGRILFALSALIVAALACTIGQAAPPTVDLPATITAQALTLQAPSQTSGPPTGTPPPAPTNTPALPLASVSSSSNCRKGPNIYYGLLWTMQPGITAEVVGKHTPSRTWIVKYPNGQCWLFGARTTVRGNIAALPEYPQPHTHRIQGCSTREFQGQHVVQSRPVALHESACRTDVD